MRYFLEQFVDFKLINEQCILRVSFLDRMCDF